MPRTRTIGRGNNDGYGAYDECYQGTAQTEILREVETEERQVIMQEVTEPDAEGEKDKQRHVLHVFHREHTLPDARERRFHLIIYGKPFQQPVKQQQGCHATNSRYEITGRRELLQDGIDRGTRLFKESAEGGHLKQDGQSGNNQHQQRVDSPLGDHCAQGFGEGHAVIAF